jgi:hypothetical protein
VVNISCGVWEKLCVDENINNKNDNRRQTTDDSKKITLLNEDIASSCKKAGLGMTND